MKGKKKKAGVISPSWSAGKIQFTTATPENKLNVVPR